MPYVLLPVVFGRGQGRDLDHDLYADMFREVGRNLFDEVHFLKRNTNTSVCSPGSASKVTRTIPVWYA